MSDASLRQNEAHPHSAPLKAGLEGYVQRLRQAGWEVHVG